MLTFEYFSRWRVISEHAKIVSFLYSPESLLYHQSLSRLPSHQFGISWPTPLQPSCLCGSSLATWWLSNTPTTVSSKTQECRMMSFLYNITLLSTCTYLGVSGRKSIPNARMNPTRTWTESEILHPKKKRSHIKLTTDPTCGQKVPIQAFQFFCQQFSFTLNWRFQWKFFSCLLHEKK